MKNTTYIIQDREAGNYIEGFSNYADASSCLEGFEETDKKEGNYTPNFYEIVKK
jgi:hypothetical protein